MALNLIKRTIFVPNFDPLLADYMENTDVFLVMITKDSDVFYLSDATDNNQFYWTQDPKKALQFMDGRDALELSEEVRRARRSKDRVELKVTTVKTLTSIFLTG